MLKKHIVANIIGRPSIKDLLKYIDRNCPITYKYIQKQAMQYIRGTKQLTLTIKSSNNPKWWVYSSYAVQPDMKSHTGINDNWKRFNVYCLM